MLPVNLTETVVKLGEAATGLAEEVRGDREQRAIESAADRIERKRVQRRQTTLLVVIGVLVAFLAGLSVSNRLLGNQNRSIIATIDSCTNANGKCAQEGQKRTAEVLAELVRRMTQANVEVIACDREEPTDAGYRSCVARALAKLNAPPPNVSPPPSAPPSPAPSGAALTSPGPERARG